MVNPQKKLNLHRIKVLQKYPLPHPSQQNRACRFSIQKLAPPLLPPLDVQSALRECMFLDLLGWRACLIFENPFSGAGGGGGGVAAAAAAAGCCCCCCCCCCCSCSCSCSCSFSIARSFLIRDGSNCSSCGIYHIDCCRNLSINSTLLVGGWTTRLKTARPSGSSPQVRVNMYLYGYFQK